MTQTSLFDLAGMEDHKTEPKMKSKKTRSKSLLAAEKTIAMLVTTIKNVRESHHDDITSLVAKYVAVCRERDDVVRNTSLAADQKPIIATQKRIIDELTNTTIHQRSRIGHLYNDNDRLKRKIAKLEEEILKKEKDEIELQRDAKIELAAIAAFSKDEIATLKLLTQWSYRGNSSRPNLGRIYINNGEYSAINGFATVTVKNAPLGTFHVDKKLDIIRDATPLTIKNLMENLAQKQTSSFQMPLSELKSLVRQTIINADCPMRINKNSSFAFTNDAHFKITKAINFSLTSRRFLGVPVRNAVLLLSRLLQKNETVTVVEFADDNILLFKTPTVTIHVMLVRSETSLHEEFRAFRGSAIPASKLKRMLKSKSGITRFKDNDYFNLKRALVAVSARETLHIENNDDEFIAQVRNVDGAPTWQYLTFHK